MARDPSTVVRLDRIYTRGGDQGRTSLGNGQRVLKHALRIRAGGAIDEANAYIGIARLHVSQATDAMLARIQNDLFDAGADLTMPARRGRRAGNLRISTAQVRRLEGEIDELNARLAPLTSFILPGGTSASAHLHVARAIVRRAEVELSALAARAAVRNELLAYVNRLSDHLFVLARTEAARAGGDVLWVPGANQ